MLKLKYTFDNEFDVRPLTRGIDKAVKRALNDTADLVLELAKPNLPKDTGKLRKSWRKEIISNLEMNAGFDIIYAMYQHQGRRADGTHIIRNRPAGGKSFFLKLAIDENEEKIFTYLYKQIDKYL
jgi:hypothetical protein